MSAGPRAAVASPAPWELGLLLLAGAVAVLPDLFDVDAFKTGAVALLVAAVLLPRLLVAGTEDVRAWFGCAAGRLHLLAAALALPLALGSLPNAGVTDRLLGTALAATAAVLGLRAAQAGLSLPRALHAATLAVAVACLLQAVGLWEDLTELDPEGRPEIVGLLGNSTRAGALLALGVTAAFAQLLTPDARDPAFRERLAASVLNLGTAALLLTRARGAWLAAAAGLVVVALLSRGALRPRLRTWGVPLAVGVALAFILGDGSRLLASKVQRDGALLSRQDVTAQVRLSVWSGTLRLVEDHALLGVGLGRFRQAYPPYRDPAEAALPGREGLPTEVDHPHNELLLPFAEGGVLAGLCLLAFLGLTLRRAAARAGGAAGAFAEPPADGGVSDRAALGVLVASCVSALVQNAWTTPGTALPFFAAAGWVWRPMLAPQPAGAGARAATRVLLGALLLGLLVLALPRTRTHVQWWRFFRAADRDGINLQNIEVLVDAADASPGDVDIQMRLVQLAGDVQRDAPQVADRVAAPKERAEARVARLREPIN
jgi:O-antigen ligase